MFGLHLKILNNARDRKRCTHILKPVNQCSNSILTKRATNIGKHMLVEFNKKAPKFYNSEDVPVLEVYVIPLKSIPLILIMEMKIKLKRNKKMNQWLEHWTKETFQEILIDVYVL